MISYPDVSWYTYSDNTKKKTKKTCTIQYSTNEKQEHIKVWRWFVEKNNGTIKFTLNVIKPAISNTKQDTRVV